MARVLDLVSAAVGASSAMIRIQLRRPLDGASDENQNPPPGDARQGPAGEERDRGLGARRSRLESATIIKALCRLSRNSKLKPPSLIRLRRGQRMDGLRLACSLAARCQTKDPRGYGSVTCTGRQAHVLGNVYRKIRSTHRRRLGMERDNPFPATPVCGWKGSGGIRALMTLRVTSSAG